MGTWSEDYKREQTTSAGDVADIIRDTISIEDALGYYRPDIQPRHRRCPCPIHDGKDYNFSFTDTHFKCFVCNESGDVIALVKEMLRLPTRADAMKQLRDDFHIRVDFHAPLSAETSAKVNAIRAERERKKKELEEWEQRYHDAIDRWIELDKTIMNTPWDSEENIAKVCKAKEERARAGYHLDLVLAQEPR